MTSFSSFYVVPCLFHFVPVSQHIPLCFSSLCSSCNDFANVLFLLDNQWSGLSGGVSPDWRQYHCHMWEIPYLLLDLERFLTHPQTRHLWRKDTRAYISHRGIKKIIIVHPKIKKIYIYSPSGHKRCRRISLFSKILKTFFHYITWSLMDPLQWMGAVSMRVLQ